MRVLYNDVMFSAGNNNPFYDPHHAGVNKFFGKVGLQFWREIAISTFTL